MKVQLINSLPLKQAVLGARVCYLSESINEEQDKKLIRHIIKNNHTSVLEHVVFTFYIDGISRGCLQEFIRHRMASPSVQSTRYTLKKVLLNEIEIDKVYCHTGIAKLDNLIKRHIQEIIDLAKEEKNIPNDMLKYALPEAFKVSMVWTINARSLRNFLNLRLSKKAHWEIRLLAHKLYLLIENEYGLLFEDIYEKYDLCEIPEVNAL